MTYFQMDLGAVLYANHCPLDSKKGGVLGGAVLAPVEQSVRIDPQQ